MKNFQVLLTAFVLAATTPAFAQDLLIRNANVHTVSDIAILGGDVMIRDGMIATVGKVSSADAAKLRSDDDRPDRHHFACCRNFLGHRA